MRTPAGANRLEPWQDARELPAALALAAFLLAVYLLTYSGVPHNPDEWFYLAGTQAAVTGDWPGVQSHGWLFSVLVAPFYAVAMLIPGLGSFQAAALLNNVVTALTAAILFLALRTYELSRGWRAAAALVYGLGTLAWPYSRYLFREPMAGLFLLIAVWGAARFSRSGRPGALVAAAVAFGCATAIKFTLLAFLPFLALPVALVIARRWLPRVSARQRVLVGVITAAAIIGAAAWAVHEPAQVARLLPHYARRLPDLGTFAALWVSPGWGLFLFAPALLLGLAGGGAFARRDPGAAFIALGGSLFYILESTTNPFWWGYWAFGPRQLVPLIPLLCLPIPFGLRWLRARWGRGGLVVASAVVGLSALVQLIGVMAPFNQYAYRVFLGAGLTGPAITWRWDLWPIPGMARFLRPELLDIAWLTGRATGAIQPRWSILAGLTVATLVAGGWLWRIMRGRKPAAGRGATWVSLALCLAWAPMAVWAARGVYLDERYRPDLGYPAAAQMVRDGRRAGDLLMTDLWAENLTGPTVAMLNYCRGGCPPRVDLVREDLVHRETNWQRARLADLVGYRRVWLVLDRVADGDPNSIVERWLGEVGYLERCQWAGPQVRLCRYGLGPGEPLGRGPADVVFGDAIALRRAEIRRDGGRGGGPDTVAPGDQLLIDLGWEALRAPAASYTASLQLLGPDGSLAAGADVQPGNGFHPTDAWQPGERPSDRRSLTVPETAPPGVYRLLLILYDPADGHRLPAGSDGDALPLLVFEVGP